MIIGFDGDNLWGATRLTRQRYAPRTIVGNLRECHMPSLRRKPFSRVEVPQPLRNPGPDGLPPRGDLTIASAIRPDTPEATTRTRAIGIGAVVVPRGAAGVGVRVRVRAAIFPL